MDKRIPLYVKNSSGDMVCGADASNAWMEYFKLLSQEDTDSKDFDSGFYKVVDNYVHEFGIQSFNCTNELDAPIELQEIKTAVKKLKRSKACGLDGIMNETFKYGGDQALEHLTYLCNEVFRTEDFPKMWSKGLISPI